MYFSNPSAKAHDKRFYSFLNLPYLEGIRWNSRTSAKVMLGSYLLGKVHDFRDLKMFFRPFIKPKELDEIGLI
jgi:hypothetical protein